jgi:hypothetical protein
MVDNIKPTGVRINRKKYEKPLKNSKTSRSPDLYPNLNDQAKKGAKTSREPIPLVFRNTLLPHTAHLILKCRSDGGGNDGGEMCGWMDEMVVLAAALAHQAGEPRVRL